ncbi:MAG: MFS transporter [Betaproteobacteria bacterium]|nr:MFS transporter [Betaproteobacteria bacterium]
MSPLKRNIGLLAACQALLLTNGVSLIAINGLMGYALAADKRLATLPVTTYVIGSALTTLPASFFMKHFGRRAGFMLGSLLGLLGALLSAYAVSVQNFWLLCAGTLLAGAYNAFGLQYRFAAADAAPPDWKSKAISLTLAGGILGGVLGPETGKLTRNLLEPPFMASYAVLALFALISLLLASRLQMPPATPLELADTTPERPIRQIARQPAFIVAVLAAVCGYGMMNLLMTATPLAMDVCRLPFNDTAFVLEWHVIGMFAPSFFTGSLIKRFGVVQILLAGSALMLACTAIALSGVTLMHFWWALVLLGIGWNFLYIGGTTLLTETYHASEKAKVQGGNDFLVFATQGVSSLSAGAVLIDSGWSALVTFALPLILITTLASVWLLWLRRRQPVT